MENYTSFGQVARAATNYRTGNDTTLNVVPKSATLSQVVLPIISQPLAVIIMVLVYVQPGHCGAETEVKATRR